MASASDEFNDVTGNYVVRARMRTPGWKPTFRLRLTTFDPTPEATSEHRKVGTEPCFIWMRRNPSGVMGNQL